MSDFDYAAAREFLRRKDEVRGEALRRRMHAAHRDFDRIVNLVIERYHPARIYQWGSLLDPRTFAEWSDIDIAVEGITSAEQFLALYREASEVTGFELDLVQLEKAHPAYAASIRERGRLVYERN
ncbi:MAG: nucleotidyltransferase domain-containing protein [Spirochaetaceae bacterium]|nr:nucleotidyltransferase domain-containing protein [Spirochaetaceae bacterium]